MSLSALLGGQAARICIRFADAATRQTVCVHGLDGRDEEQYLFSTNDNICGTVRACLLVQLWPVGGERSLRGWIRLTGHRCCFLPLSAPVRFVVSMRCSPLPARFCCVSVHSLSLARVRDHRLIWRWPAVASSSM